MADPAPLQDQAAAAFAAHFGTAPQAVAFAPGRVNLMGEHTDYNGGFVLPMPLSLGTAMAIGRGDAAGQLRLASQSFEGEETRQIGEQARGSWSDYILGCVTEAAPETMLAHGLNAMVVSDLPVGAGLSSSAAIEVCSLRALHALACTTSNTHALACTAPDAVATALTARHVENSFVGMPCGIMDPFSVSVGQIGQALFLDTRRLTHREVALPPDHKIAVIHSGVSHKLTEDGYARRVSECNRAAAALRVTCLSDLTAQHLDRVAKLHPPLDRRARHIILENQNVVDSVAALDRGDAARFGQIMIASHATQRDNYNVSVPEVDALVETALQLGARGARLTGGGFGGSVVALLEAHQAEAICEGIAARLPSTRLLALM